MIKVLKIIIDNQSKEVELSVSEMLEKFDDMLNQFAHQCVEKTSGYQGCTEEFDDYKQLAIIKAIEKFEGYDISKGAFSTILVKSLRGLLIDIIRKNESQMRKSKEKLIYIDAPIGENGDSASEIIAGNDLKCFEDDATDLERFLINNLTKEEMMFYTIELKKQVSKASLIQKVCLQHTIDSFLVMVGEIPDKKEEIAESLGISRPTLNKRIKEAVSKVKDLAEDFCLSNMALEDLPF